MSRKIKGKFYPLQADEWVETTKNLNYSEIKILYYLRTISSSEDKFTLIKTKEIAETLELSIRSVQRALNRLSERGLIERVAPSHQIISAKVKTTKKESSL